MSTEDFVAWAMSPERTVEERFGVEKAVEWGVDLERRTRGLAGRHDWQQQSEIHKARRLNPAYAPALDREEVRRGAAGLRLRKEYQTEGYGDRPVRDLQWLRFFPHFEDVALRHVEVDDYSPLTALPDLRKLHLADDQVLDLRPLGKCTGLQDLYVRVRQPWAKVEGLERLEKLETVQWLGSPLVLQAIPRWPAVRRAAFREHCMNFPLRDALQLPEMPLLEELDLESIFSLEGLERYPRLVNLKVAGTFRDLRPLTACRALTHLWLELSIHLDLDVLRDVSPLAALPELRYVHVRSQRPRDYSPLVEAPRLHEVELHASLNKPLKACAMELAALNATLEPWDTEFLTPEPRPLPPLRVRFIDPQKQEKPPEPAPLPGPPPPWEENRGFRRSEGRWLANRISARLFALFDRDEHWGKVGAADHPYITLPIAARYVSVEITSQEAAERLREIIAVVRSELARTRCRWQASLHVRLELPPVNDPRAMAEIDRLRELANDEDRELKQREEAEFLERQHRLELQKESGGKIRPEDFAASPPEPKPEEDEEGDTERTIGDEMRELREVFAPDRPHPLAEQYAVYGGVSEADMWFYEGCREAAQWLMGDEPKP